MAKKGEATDHNASTVRKTDISIPVFSENSQENRHFNTHV